MDSDQCEVTEGQFCSTESALTDTDVTKYARQSKKSERQGCTTRCRLKDNLLLILTISGVLAGIALGFIVREFDPSVTTIILLKFPGEIFMRMLKMLIIPVIFTSIITGLANLDIKRGGKMGLHALVYYVSTTILAVFLAIILAIAIHPGHSKPEDDLQYQEVPSVSPLDTYMDIVRNLFPENIIGACFETVRTKVSVSSEQSNNRSTNETNTTTRTQEYVHNANVLGVISFCVAFGVVLSSLGEEGRPVSELIQSLHRIFIKMMKAVILCSPIGICSIISGEIIQLEEFESIGRSVGMYMATTIVGYLIHVSITLPLIFFIVTRHNPFKVLIGIGQAMLTAFGLASSLATLPVTMQCLEHNVGIDRRVVKFVLPIGATINMDGAAIFEAVACITIAQIHNVPLSFGQFLIIGVTATLASIGAAAIPGAAMVALLLVVTSVGIPAETVAIFWSVDWLVGCFRTCVNIYGDCIGAALVHHLNRDYLRQRGLGTLEQ